MSGFLVNVGSTFICTSIVTNIILHFIGDPLDIATEHINESLADLQCKVAIIDPSVKAGLKAIHCRRSEIPASYWREKLRNKPSNIDYLNASGERNIGSREDAELILYCIAGQSNVRILCPNPYSNVVDRLKNFEGVDNFDEQILISLTKFCRAARGINIGIEELGKVIRLYDYSIQCSFSRFDDEILVTHYLHGWSGGAGPSFIFQNGSSGMFEKYLTHFSNIWKFHSIPSDELLERISGSHNNERMIAPKQ